MSLPEGFNTWEHLQDMLRRDHNRILARYFKDLGPNWQPEITSSRGAIRTACTILDDDTSTITLIKLIYFYVILGYAFQGLAPVFGVPSQEFQEAFELHPQIFLYFSQDKQSVPDGFRPVEAEIKFRIKGYTKSSLSPAAAIPFANRIAAEFVENKKGILFSKGKQIVSYTDVEHGLKSLKIYAISESEGINIIKKVIRVLNIPFSDDFIGISDKPKRSSVTVPVGKEVVYGKTVRKKRWRPNAKVRFRYAYLIIDNREYPIILVDTTGRYPDAIVKAWK